MDNATHIGLDVHRDTIAVAVLGPGETSADERTIPATTEAITRLVRTLNGRGPLVACYEAGPTGYDTQRLLVRLGVPCEVIPPAMIPRRPGTRVKTDRLDARNLARLHRAGELTASRIPSPAEEALRDLVRVREDLKAERRRARQRIQSFLLQHGRPRPSASSSAGAAKVSPPRCERSVGRPSCACTRGTDASRPPRDHAGPSSRLRENSQGSSGL